uniref:NAC domain-containing protein n=1 Tax=Ananas comosus var. bracteatus TaxID=296719 RepID=A0A6V7PC68_ANACO|nr:unnamed protein product [Ananas comosus var. bracteatus]
MAQQYCCQLCGKDLPPGFKFTPDDEQLIDPYLLHYARTGDSIWYYIVKAQVCEKEPSELLGDDCDERYFFTSRTKRTPTSSSYNRTVGSDGRWHSKEPKIPIKLAGKITIGFKTVLYHQKRTKTNYKYENTGFTMCEYELHPSLSVPSSSNDKEERVLCCVKKSQQKKNKEKRKAEEPAEAAVGSTEQAHHENVVTADQQPTSSSTDWMELINAVAYLEQENDVDTFSQDLAALAQHHSG